jgi:hypothetical protein
MLAQLEVAATPQLAGFVESVRPGLRLKRARPSRVLLLLKLLCCRVLPEREVSTREAPSSLCKNSPPSAQQFAPLRIPPTTDAAARVTQGPDYFGQPIHEYCQATWTFW